MKKYIFLIVSLINLCVMAFYLSFLPDTIPVHFNFSGEVDRYGSKWELLIISGILVLFGLGYVIYEIVRKHMCFEEKNRKYSHKIVSVVFVFLLATTWIASAMCIKSTVIDKNFFMSLMLVIMGALIMFVSNLMPKLKQNLTTGIKIRATLKSEVVWKKTHRLAGITGVVAGSVSFVCGIVSILIGGFEGWIFMAVIIFMIVMLVLIPYIYANVLYSKVKNK